LLSVKSYSLSVIRCWFSGVPKWVNNDEKKKKILSCCENPGATNVFLGKNLRFQND
jgi:hypothetical protein